MIQKDGMYFFGFWEDMPYRTVTDRYEDFEQYSNGLDRNAVIRHIESLEPAIASAVTTDRFTGERFNAGLYEDGDFVFPVDFLRYYKTREIGIPSEYEAYLRTVL